MEYLKLDTLALHTVDKGDRVALDFIKKLCHDKSISERFTGITGGLLSNPNNEFFGYGFLVTYNNEYIGYIRIGNIFEDEKSVYLRAAIDKDTRGHNFGATLLNEITEYIFYNFHEVESIRLKIAPDNIPSLKTAEAGGYKWLNDDYFVKYNPYLTSELKK